MGPATAQAAKQVTCPGCGATKPEGEWPVDVKHVLESTLSFSARSLSVLSVGFRCPDCGTTWGHEA